MNKAVRGFTLIELMVVIGIIGILASIVFVGARPAGEQSRDTARQSDLRQVQTALELYKNRYGRYPERCASAHPDWSGQMDTDYECNVPNQAYILGNIAEGRLFAEFMVNLPKDPKLNGTNPGNSGYVYTVNSDGSVYKLMVKNTAESEIVTPDHAFASCAAGCASSIGHCQSGSVQFDSSYAVWGGLDNSVPANIRDNTDQIICEIE